MYIYIWHFVCLFVCVCLFTHNSGTGRAIVSVGRGPENLLFWGGGEEGLAGWVPGAQLGRQNG